MSSEVAVNDIEKKVQDLANNNVLVEQVDQLSLQPMTSANDQYLFEPSLLAELNPSDFLFKYDKCELKYVEGSDSQCYFDLGDNLALRPLRRDDYERGYFDLLAQLTEVGDVGKIDYERRFDNMKRSNGTYYTCVVEETSINKVVASVTLVYEQKFIRSTGARGRIEDVVVDQEFRGKRLSKVLLDVLGQMSKKLGCYKVSLECKDWLRKHYEQFGYHLEDKQNYMCKRV